MAKFISYHQQLSSLTTSLLADKLKQLAGSEFDVNLDKLADFLTAGKMLRGSLAINTYSLLAKQQPSPDIYLTATAIELIGSFLLIHDDIIDQDNLRRGSLTIHRQFEQKATKLLPKDALHYGQSMAICLGDYLIFWAYELIAQISNPKQAQKISAIFSKQILKTTLGQMLDINATKASLNEVSQAEILNIYRQKTGSYTTCLPLMAGAVLAGEDSKLTQQLQYSTRIPLVFKPGDELFRWSFCQLAIARWEK
jgi:geranylgeranyl diphosphate synthase type I